MRSLACVSKPETSAALTTASEPIDVVYTWVDGSTPGYAELLQQHARRAIDLNPNRFRNNLDILKYSLRSLQTHAPWIRKVYVVTTRPQVPHWLDTSAHGLTLLHHEEVFDLEDLPTFNSFAIVCNLVQDPRRVAPISVHGG